MNVHSTSDQFDLPNCFETSEFCIRLIGGTVVGKLRWYFRLVGLLSLGMALSIVVGTAIGLIANNGDVGILISLFLFVLSAIVAVVRVKRRIGRPAIIRLNASRLTVESESMEIVNWSYGDIQSIRSDYVASGSGLGAVIPSGNDVIFVEHQNDSIVFELQRDLATQLLVMLKTRTKNSVISESFSEPFVPADSVYPDQVWKSKLRAEFRRACSEIALGGFGMFFLCLFVYGFLSGQRPQGNLGRLSLMILSAVLGPFILYSGIQGLLKYFSRRRRFARLSKQNQRDKINELLEDLYGSKDF